MIFVAKELLRHRSIAQSIIEESVLTIETQKVFLAELWQKELLKNIETDRSHRPYILLQTSPESLYRTAIEDCYLFRKQAQTNLVTVYKSEQSVQKLAEDFHSDAYSQLSTERRQSYASYFIEAVKKVNSESADLQKNLSFWKGRGVIIILLIMLDITVLSGWCVLML